MLSSYCLLTAVLAPLAVALPSNLEGKKRQLPGLSGLLGLQGLQGNVFIPAAVTDARSPCPALNSLANHGFLPRNGLNISRQQINEGMAAAFNIDPALTDFITGVGLATSTTGVPDTLHLDDLARPGGLEKDGSLSRQDAVTGDAQSFSPTVWAPIAQQLGNQQVSIEQVAQIKAARVAAAQAANPAFNLSGQALDNSFLEIGFFMVLFQANPFQIRAWFEQERLPFELGFQRSAQIITQADFAAVGDQVKAASGVAVAPAPA